MFLPTDAIAGRIIKKMTKPVVDKMKKVADIDNIAHSAVMEEVTRHSDKWKNKVTKSATLTPKPKPTQPPKSWGEKIKNEKKSNSTRNRERGL